MKRFIRVLMVIIFFAFPITLHADVVGGNDFFYENEDKTEIIGEEYHGKSFIINSPLGYVIPKEEPGSGKGIPTDKGYSNHFGEKAPDTDVFIFKNGEVKTIKAVYLYNGEYWGVMSPSHIYQPPGWVLMDDLLMRYELKDFEIENQIYTYTGNYDFLSVDKLVFWQWPGSDREKVVITDEDILKMCSIENAYMDSEGREWGKIAHGWGWVCLSDPENKTDIPSFNPALKPVKWSHDGNRDSKEAKVWPPAEPSFIQANPFKTIYLFIAIFSILIFAIVMIGSICRIKHKKS